MTDHEYIIRHQQYCADKFREGCEEIRIAAQNLARLQREHTSSVHSNTMMRDDLRLTKLLTMLEAKDDRFQQMVPWEKRNKLSDRSLLRFLRRRYHKKELVLDMGGNWGGTANVGDIIQFSIDEAYTHFYLNHGSEGVINNICDYGVDVKFSGNVKASIIKSNLVLLGRKGSFWRRKKTFPATAADNILLKKGDLVKYIGDEETCLSGRYYVKSGVRAGVVDTENGLYVKWDRAPCIRACYVNSVFVDLVHRSNIDFDKLYRECYR